MHKDIRTERRDVKLKSQYAIRKQMISAHFLSTLAQVLKHELVNNDFNRGKLIIDMLEFVRDLKTL